MGLHPSIEKLRRKAPQLIVVAVAIILIAYIAFEILEDVLIEGTPITSDPWISAIVSFTKDVTATVSSWGYTGIFGLMLLESSSLPVPSEVVLPFCRLPCLHRTTKLWINRSGGNPRRHRRFIDRLFHRLKGFPSPRRAQGFRQSHILHSPTRNRRQMVQEIRFIHDLHRPLNSRAQDNYFVSCRRRKDTAAEICDFHDRQVACCGIAF